MSIPKAHLIQYIAVIVYLAFMACITGFGTKSADARIVFLWSIGAAMWVLLIVRILWRRTR